MTTSRSEFRKQLLFVVALAALVSSSCSGRPPDKPLPRAMVVADDGAVLGVRVAQPTTMYGLARHALMAKSIQGGGAYGGGKVGALPQSLPLLVVSLLGLPPLLAGRLAEQGDWLGVVSQTANRQASWALGVPLQSGTEFVAELTLGAGAPRRASARRGWTELEGTNFGALGAMCVGVTSNTLVFGPTCAGVEILVARLTAEQPVAPPMLTTGLSVRLLTQTSVLQGVYAAWGAQVWLLLESLASPVGDVFPPGVETALTLLNSTVSAYLGHIESGDMTLALEGSRLVVNGSFAAKSLPGPVPRHTLCDALANIPDETALWLAGIGDRVQDQASPDWDTEVGEWERSIVLALAFAGGTAFSPSARVPAGSGPWVVGVRDSEAGRTFWALLQGLTPMYLTQSSVGTDSQHGQATARSRPSPSGEGPLVTRTLLPGGRTVEWGVTPWRDGVVVAVGAPLGAHWQAWSTKQSAPRTTPVLRSASCVGVVGGVGVGSFAELVVVRVPEGLELKGLLDVTGQWSTTR